MPAEKLFQYRIKWHVRRVRVLILSPCRSFIELIFLPLQTNELLFCALHYIIGILSTVNSGRSHLQLFI